MKKALWGILFALSGALGFAACAESEPESVGVEGVEDPVNTPESLTCTCKVCNNPSECNIAVASCEIRTYTIPHGACWAVPKPWYCCK